MTVSPGQANVRAISAMPWVVPDVITLRRGGVNAALAHQLGNTGTQRGSPCGKLYSERRTTASERFIECAGEVAGWVKVGAASAIASERIPGSARGVPISFRMLGGERSCP
ncbi:MAG: hypothetical protein U0074_02815 [Kouleothrix sp.]